MSGSIGSVSQFQPSVVQQSNLQGSQRQSQGASAEVASARQDQENLQVALDIINENVGAPVPETSPATQGRGQIVNLLV